MHKVLLPMFALAALAGCAEMKTDMDKMMGIEVKSKLIACPPRSPSGMFLPAARSGSWLPVALN